MISSPLLPHEALRCPHTATFTPFKFTLSIWYNLVRFRLFSEGREPDAARREQGGRGAKIAPGPPRSPLKRQTLR